MNKVLPFIFVILFSFESRAQNIGIGTNTPNASAALEIRDTSRGILIPRMTMSQRNAIQNPAEGLMVYQTDSTKGFWYFNGLSWNFNSIKNGLRRGEMLYWNGNAWVTVNPGANGQTLTYCNGVPTWGPCPPSNPLININQTIKKTYYTYWMLRSDDLYYYYVMDNGNVIGYRDTIGNPIPCPQYGYSVSDYFHPNWAPLTPDYITISAEVSDTTTGNSNPLEIYDNGFYWATTPDPDINDNIVYSGYGAGPFSITFSELVESQTYYFKPFCNTNNGYFYGNELTYLHKKITEPNITSIPTNIITSTSIKFGGEITSGYECIVSERGVCWSTTPNPTISNNKTTDFVNYDGLNHTNLSGTYQHDLTDLTPGTTYYIRAYETNSISNPWITNRFNTKYGQEYTITTLIQ